MKREYISQVLEQIDTAYIEEATTFPGAKTKNNKLVFYISIAACMTIFLTCTVWLLLRNASPKDSGNWDIMMEHSTSQTIFPTHGSLPTESMDEPRPITTDPSAPTDSTSPTDWTDPSTDPTVPTESSEHPSSSVDLNDPPEPGCFSDGDYLDYVTDSPISLGKIPFFQASGSEFYLIQPVFSELHFPESTQGSIYPIYLDPYPVDQSGPQYDITEEYIAEAQGNMGHYLSLIFGNGDYTGVYNPDIPYALFYDREDLSIVAGKESLSVTSTAYDVYSTLTLDDLDTNPLFRAALSYIGIVNPSITAEIEYDIKGKVYQYNYFITEYTENPQESLFNRTFSHITIRSYVDGNLLSISLIHRDQPVEVGATTLATTEDIEDYLQKFHPELAQKPHVTEVFYSPNVLTGYYIPSYRIYFEEAQLSEEYGAPAYTVLELTDSRFLN